MTDHEKDAAHARDELRIATMLLARWRGSHEADAMLAAKGLLAMPELTPSQKALYHDTCKFMRRTSLFPKVGA